MLQQTARVQAEEIARLRGQLVRMPASAPTSPVLPAQMPSQEQVQQWLQFQMFQQHMQHMQSMQNMQQAMFFGGMQQPQQQTSLPPLFAPLQSTTMPVTSK